MPYVPIKSQGHGGPKVMADFKGYLLRQYAWNQKTNGALWYSKTISKFQLDRFLIFIHVRCHMTFNIRLIREVDRLSCVELIIHIVTSLNHCSVVVCWLMFSAAEFLSMHPAPAEQADDSHPPPKKRNKAVSLVSISSLCLPSGWVDSVGIKELEVPANTTVRHRVWYSAENNIHMQYAICTLEAFAVFC